MPFPYPALLLSPLVGDPVTDSCQPQVAFCSGPCMGASSATVAPPLLDLWLRSGPGGLAVAVKASPETTGVLIFYQPEHVMNFPAQ